MKKLLTPEQVKEKLDKFNETYDHSIFDDVLEEQAYLFLYPHTLKSFNLEKFQQELSKSSGIPKKYFDD